MCVLHQTGGDILKIFIDQRQQSCCRNEDERSLERLKVGNEQNRFAGTRGCFANLVRGHVLSRFKPRLAGNWTFASPALQGCSCATARAGWPDVRPGAKHPPNIQNNAAWCRSREKDVCLTAPSMSSLRRCDSVRRSRPGSSAEQSAPIWHAVLWKALPEPGEAPCSSRRLPCLWRSLGVDRWRTLQPHRSPRGAPRRGRRHRPLRHPSDNLWRSPSSAEQASVPFWKQGRVCCA